VTKQQIAHDSNKSHDVEKRLLFARLESKMTR